MEERAKQLIVYVYNLLKGYYEEITIQDNVITVATLSITVNTDNSIITFCVKDNLTDVTILSIVYSNNLHPLLECIRIVCFFNLKYNKDNA